MLFIGDDWAEGHHDMEVEGDTGRRLARMRLSEGVEGLARLHEVIAEHLDTDPDSIGTDAPTEGAVVVGIELTVGCGSRSRSPADTRCMRSTRCRPHDIESGIAPPEPNPTPAMLMSWPRSSGWTVIITVNSPGSRRRSKP